MSFALALQWLFSSAGGPLRARAVRGGVWLAIGGGVTRVAGVAKVAVLGRLLSPADFGLMGIANVAVKWLEFFTTTGIKDALIRTPGDIRPYLDTAWTVQIVRSLALTAVIFAGAPLGAWFFASPEATWVIRAVGLVPAIRGFTNPAVVFLPKELDFRRDVLWRLTGTVAGLAVGVGLAVAYRDVWALVFSVVAAQVVETAASYWAAPYLPRPRMERSRLAELMRFGKWIFWWNLVGFLGFWIDNVVVGKLMGTTALGFYQVAYQFAFLAVAPVGSYVHGVMFPTFSRLQGALHVRRAFLRIATLVASVVIPIGAFAAVFAEPLIHALLGAQWMPITPSFRVLVLAAIASALTGTATPLFQAIGRPELPVRVSLVKLGVLVVLLYPLIAVLGLVGAALAVAVSALLEMAYQAWLVTRLLGTTAREAVSAFSVALRGAAPFLAAAVLVLPSPSLSPTLVVVGALALALSASLLVRPLRRQLGSLSAPPEAPAR